MQQLMLEPVICFGEAEQHISPQLQTQQPMDNESDLSSSPSTGHSPDQSPDHSPYRSPEPLPPVVPLEDQPDITAIETGSTFGSYSEDEEDAIMLSRLWSLLETDHGICSNPGPRLMDGREFPDGLSPVFARDLCWNVRYSELDARGKEPLVPWPSSEEFASYGADRARIGLRRCLPLPREDRLADGFDPTQAVYNDDATLSSQFRHIELGRLYLDKPHQPMPLTRHLLWVRQKLDEMQMDEEQVDEVHMADLPYLTQDLIRSIDEDQRFDRGVDQDEETWGPADQSPTPAKPRRRREYFC